MEKLIIAALVAVFVAVLSVPIAAYQRLTSDTVSISVQDKERVSKSDSSKYMIFTENEVFENSDALFHFKFSSHDLYAKLKIGHTYNCKVYGWRVPFLSMTRNIVSCD